MAEFYAAPDFDQEVDFDVIPEEPRGTTEIASGLYRYLRAAKQLQEYHTGSTEVYLSSDEEQELASVIQATATAQAGIDKLRETDPKGAAQAAEKYGHLLAGGKAAEHKLVECNLRMAAFYARASMNILPGKKKTAASEETSSDALTDDYRPERRRIGAYGDITRLRSPRADLEERTAVANLALVEAAQSFVPNKRDKEGRLVSFFSHASYRIHSALSVHAKVNEVPGWHVYASTVDTIYKASKFPEEFTPEKLAEITRCDEGRFTVPIDEMRVAGDYDFDTLSETSQPLADMVAAPHRDIEGEMDAEKLSKLIEDIFDTLSEREAGTISLRFGLSDQLDLYDQPHNLDQIGRVYGVTRERVRQIEQKTLGKLRHPSRSQLLRDYIFVDASMEEHPISPYQIEPHVPGFPNMRTERVAGQKALNATAVIVPIEIAGETLQQKATTGESWQAYADEPWDMQEAKGIEQTRQYEETGRLFNQLLFFSSPYTFQQSFAEAMGNDYPVGFVEQINDVLGPNLTASHIEDFWSNQLENFVTLLERQLGDDFALDRVSTLLSKLLAERMTDEDNISLAIPESLDGRLNFVGSWIKHGQLTIRGNTGDFTGYKIGGIAVVKVQGSVRDFAGVEASNYALLEIDGDAGHFLGGQAKQSAHIRVHGSVGDNCGDEISGEDVVIEVGQNAGEAVANNARKGSIIVRGTTKSSAANYDPTITLDITDRKAS